MDSRDYSGSMYPPQDPGQEMTNMAYIAPPSQFGFSNMYMDMGAYTSAAAHYPPYPMALYAPGMENLSHQQVLPQQRKKPTFNKNSNFKPNPYNPYIPVAGQASNGPISSKVSDKTLEYKFEVGNRAYFNKDALTETYPIYINTTFEEFLKARNKRLALQEELAKNENSVEIKEDGEEKEEKVEKAKELDRHEIQLESESVKSISESSEGQKIEIEPLKKDKVTSTVELEESSSGDAPSIVPPGPVHSSLEKTGRIPTFTPPTAKTVQNAPQSTINTVKSWSKLASGGLNKIRQTQNSANSPTFKKEKKYVPPNVKALEPLGSVALRVCFDEEFTSHTLQNSKASKLVNDLIPRGIVNKGSICFMSSVLQLLIHCRVFVNLLNVIHISVSKLDVSISPLLEASIEIFKNFDRSFAETEKSHNKEQSKGKTNGGYVDTSFPNTSSIDPENFYKSISKLSKFRDLSWGRQEDAEEFLTHFLEQLHEEFIASIDNLRTNDILNVLQSLNDEDQKMHFIKCLSKYKNCVFNDKSDPSLKALFERYKNTVDSGLDDDGEWKEVSKKGKKSKNASKRITEVDPSPISTIFGGQFRSVLDTPQNKESQSITYDPFQTIQLDISSPEVTDLESAFRKFSEHEVIELKSSSGNDVEAKKQTCIDKLPQVLLIQLKRFSFVTQLSKGDLSNYNSYNGRIEKIRKMVKYSHEFVIPKESISPPLQNSAEEALLQYRLSGVIYHHGISPSGGHYTCDVFNKALNKWFRIDDVKVEEIKNIDEVLHNGSEISESRTAYILLYERSAS